MASSRPSAHSSGPGCVRQLGCALTRAVHRRSIRSSGHPHRRLHRRRPVDDHHCASASPERADHVQGAFNAAKDPANNRSAAGSAGGNMAIAFFYIVRRVAEPRRKKQCGRERHASPACLLCLALPLTSPSGLPSTPSPGTARPGCVRASVAVTLADRRADCSEIFAAGAVRTVTSMAAAASNWMWNCALLPTRYV